MEKYIIAIKDNGFVEKGFCYRCSIEGDKVTIYDDLSRFDESFVIQIEQFMQEFKEMSKEDYYLYVDACNDGEDEVCYAVRKKYL
ncbi:hypothetical protein ABD91_20995 [Lysinibacillus sphaericus]|uniref:hypothetical protein n=1 Tax=Lysinibacillus sphaericus TaxID=1421 RepID=UPI0018CD3CC8|nr:hypothetical protein [Lysinibacillus sphaericus]MBG9693220.1 hypothetical protein [Lysinibacillus sphaericus]